MTGGLIIEDLHAAYGKTVVLQGVNLTIPPGEVCAVIGQSGVGKSTLIKCILLLEKATKGSVRHGDRRINFEAQEPIEAAILTTLRKKIGYVPQSSLLLPHLTAHRNVMWPLVDAHGQDESCAADAARAALASVGIADLMDRQPWRLSGGQQQRVAIARATAVKPSIFLFDEPTAALDSGSSHLVADIVRNEVRSRDASALLVTHNLGFARHVSDSIALLSGGRIAWHRKTAEVDIESALKDLS